MPRVGSTCCSTSCSRRRPQTSRLGKRLSRALDALLEFDAARPAELHTADRDQRETLVAAAGEALWYYVVQREVCGLRDAEAVMRDLRVPREVRLRMGVIRRPSES